MPKDKDEYNIDYNSNRVGAVRSDKVGAMHQTESVYTGLRTMYVKVSHDMTT